MSSPSAANVFAEADITRTEFVNKRVAFLREHRLDITDGGLVSFDQRLAFLFFKQNAQAFNDRAFPSVCFAEEGDGEVVPLGMFLEIGNLGVEPHFISPSFSLTLARWALPLSLLTSSLETSSSAVAISLATRAYSLEKS